jgi:outer membrane protein OmpA-like peptidoglycan-associated protein
MRRGWLAAVVVLGVLGGGSEAGAQLRPQFDLNQFRPSELTTDGFALSHADGQGHLRFGVQLYIDFSRNPLGLRVTNGPVQDSQLRLVYGQLTGHLTWSLGLWERLVFFMDLPYTFMMNENLSTDQREFLQSIGQELLIPNGRGLGDLYVGARGVLYGTRDNIFQLAAQATLTANTATAARPDQNYLGEPNRPPNIGGWFEVFGTFNAGDYIRVPLNLGFKTGFGQDVPSLALGNQLTFGAGVQALLGQDRFMLTVEAFGRTAASRDTGFGGRQETPLEILGGFKYLDRRGLAVGIAGTGGVTLAYGSPDWRLIGMIGYTMPPKQEELPVDTDGDGIFDEDDACPTEPEDFDRFEDADGCPDLDNDADGILDIDDACPDVPGPPENDGCPEGPRVVVEEGELEILEKIYFDFDSATIKERSYPVLDEVATVLESHPELGVVRIEGHTCSLGPYDYNMSLSQRRANSVRRYLVEEGGIDPDRLTAMGFGESEALIPNASTEEELARNRRVEFHFADEPTAAPVDANVGTDADASVDEGADAIVGADPDETP